MFSVDLDGIQEFTRRRTTSSTTSATSSSPFLPHHIVRSCKLTLEECLAHSDTVITGVPSKSYKIPTRQLRDGVVAINFSSEKNFEADIKERAGIYVPAIGKVTIAMLQRNLVRLVEYQRILGKTSSV